MAFTVTTLIENRAGSEELAFQHGLSLYLTDGEFSLLLDTGAGPEFLENAKKIGVDLNGLDALVLSHGHFDHTGGVKTLINSGYIPREVYMGQNFYAPRYKREEGRLRPISARFSEDFLVDNKISTYLLEPGIHQLHNRVFLVTGIPQKNSLEKPNERLICQRDRSYITDPFSEETVVVVMGDRGLALLSGCSHLGILNTCDWISHLFNQPIRTFIGGTHLMESDETRIHETMRRLSMMGVERVGACHCNGELANNLFAQHYKGFFNNVGGTVVEL
ncbi:MAG: MBL fold metallo-hydrolase [Oscillospiraceae bacterium]|nr:MBL fold metallo-hydrolase [Oscillospiraceae bacterium]